MSELLGIEIKTLDDSGFQFYQTGLIQKFLEATEMDHYDGFPTTTKVEVTLRKDENVTETGRYWKNSYEAIIGNMLYHTSNKQLDE